MVKMSESGGSERQFFGSIAKNQNKYGSTTKPNERFSKYVTHVVSRTDNLMGLALKYGSTVELIKRENKLWNNDSLFLHEHIYIPITQHNSHLVQDDWELLMVDEVRSRTQSESKSLTSSTESPSNKDNGAATSSGSGSFEGSGVNKDSVIGGRTVVNGVGGGMDFLNKYDASIASIKDRQQKMEKSSNYQEDRLLSLIPRRHSDIASRTSRSTRTVSLEHPDSPVLVIRSNTQSQTVQTAVKRSEKANEALFEL